MEFLESCGRHAVALTISLAGALFSALSAFVLIAFIGAKVFRSEAGYGFGLGFGPLAAVLTGAVMFVVIFRKIRSSS